MKAAEIHAHLGAAGWVNVLVQLGVPAPCLVRRHGPCPACGGKDRFRFDNRHGKGDYICNQCGAGDGFTLLMRVHGWDFAETRRRVLQAGGIRPDTAPSPSSAPATGQKPVPETAALPARPSARVLRILRNRCAVHDCDEVVAYLEGRGLWPLPTRHTLHAHAALEYRREAQLVGRFPALIAEVHDIRGELVTVHATYLRGGKKLEGFEPRKILSPLTGREGCAARLMPLSGDVLGIAEGTETALSAARLHGLPVWAALNATLLARFEPPPEVRQLVIFADRDVAGLEAASRLMERLQGRIALELRLPRAPAKDWNDVLCATPSPADHRGAGRKAAAQTDSSVGPPASVGTWEKL